MGRPGTPGLGGDCDDAAFAILAARGKLPVHVNDE